MENGTTDPESGVENAAPIEASEGLNPESGRSEPQAVVPGGTGAYGMAPKGLAANGVGLTGTMAGTKLPKIIPFTELCRCGDEVWIEHDGQLYRLRRTRLGKLILTK